MTTPLHCRPEAYRFLDEHLPALDTTQGLVRAAMAVAMHELTDVQPLDVERQLDELADRIRGRVRGASAQAILAHAHEVLFEEEGFTGNRDDYYNPRNSYLPVVLRTKRGLPILLTLVYKAVLDRLGLRVHGINAPGHFLAAVEVSEAAGEPGGRMLVDPFFDGQVLSQAEAFERIHQAVGGLVPTEPSLLAASTHRQWLLRIVQNLLLAFDRLGRRDTVAAMLEMQRLIETRTGAE